MQIRSSSFYSMASRTPQPNKQVAMITSLWITAENIGSFLGAVGGGAAYDRLITKDISQISVYLDIFYFISSVLDGATPACWSP